MIICICANVSDRAIAQAVREGAASVEDITMRTGACSGCGQCRGHCKAELAAQDAVRMASQSSASVPSSVPA
ncbi:MAG: bacterioferritin-associated ferredoxin [Limnobacter sp.]|uniref:(2Fe-2S)-binding protein n=1 Tax=Limnobacter sp. TaxID=2003368 RepID=UPI00391DFD84